jgi:serine/threonine protein kinase
MLGTTLAGHYKILRHLGGGGFSQTFVAEDLHLPGKPTCIIKQLKPASTREGILKIARDLFDKEAKVLYRLGRHDRIPSLLAHFEQDEEFFLAQEMVEGHVLSQEIRRRQTYNEAYVVALLEDLMVTLDFVHKQQVIHRDIKPSNLIRRQQDGKIVLIDFGAVKEVSTQAITADKSEGNTYSGVIVGSPGYMPNEQYGGRVQFASDIYAAGIICIQALTGLSATEIPEDPRTSEFLWRDQVIGSPELLDIVDKMVRFDWRQRYQSALDVLHVVQEFAPKLASNDISDLASIASPFNDAITSPPSAPTRPTEDSFSALSLLIGSGQAVSTEQVCKALEKFEDLVRVKKLLCLVCTGILENDIQRLDNFTLQELIEDIVGLNPTSAQLKNSLVEAVKIINFKRQKQYLFIAKTIFNEVVKMYDPLSSQSAIYPTQAFSKNALAVSSTNQLDSSYVQIAEELQADPNCIRIKKLLLYVSRSHWESDLEQLKKVDLLDLFAEIIELTPTTKQLEVLLLEVAGSLSKPAEYIAIAKIIINKLERVQFLSQEIAATNIYEQNISDLNSELPIAETPQDPLLKMDGKQHFDREIFADLFDMRLELLRFANPLRTKILLFSALHYPFSTSKHDWSDIRTQTLDNLLRDLFCAYLSPLEAEKKLIQVAQALEEPDQYGQAVRYVIRVLKPLYTKITDLSMRHPMEEQEQSPTPKISRTTALSGF